MPDASAHIERDTGGDGQEWLVITEGNDPVVAKAAGAWLASTMVAEVRQ